ncbi:MAG: LTA synthase family protein [Chitinophagaceae bacterium]
MFKGTFFIVIYFLAWTLFFEFARLFFLLYHYQHTSQLPASTLLGTFIYGSRMDLSMAGYITLPVCLMVLSGIMLPFFRSATPYKIYTSIILLLVLVIVTADLEMFKAWGFRIDATPLRYLSSPKEAWASVNHLPILLVLVVFAISYILIAGLFSKLISKIIRLQNASKRKWLQALFICFLSAVLIIPLRGGLQLAPINESGVYFSKFHFANIAAINATWNFFHAVSNRQEVESNPYKYMDNTKAATIADSLYKSSDRVQRVILPGIAKLNIILVIWESFTAKATQMSIHGKEVTPYFNQLKQEGIYFSNAYASGDRTDKGLSALLSGYPALPKMSVIRYPSKAAKLPSLSKVFKEKGYTTAFYYGGEPEFANIKSYLLSSNFDHIVEKNNFSKKDQNSKWGAHDGIVMKRCISDLKKVSQPFFTTWLTLSSHEPFETPITPTFKGNDHTTKFLNAHNYTDKVLYEFVQECKQQQWWKNTLMIIVADHGHPQPPTNNRFADFKIPILWLGGALNRTSYEINKVVSQLDISTSIVFQAGIEKNDFPFSKNLFDTTTPPWAFFTFNNGHGFIQQGKMLLFDNVGKRIIEQDGNIKQIDIQAAKALQQIIYEDFLKR